MIPAMRTGLAGEVDDSQVESVLATVAALMRIFCKESLKVSSRYAHAKGRGLVTAADMKKSLMYVARIFLQQENLEDKVKTELQEMEEESEEEESGESEGEASEESEGGGSERGGDVSPASPSTVKMARNVDTVAIAWSLWEPQDAIEQLIKRAIDQTPAPLEPECDES